MLDWSAVLGRGPRWFLFHPKWVTCPTSCSLSVSDLASSSQIFGWWWAPCCGPLISPPCLSEETFVGWVEPGRWRQPLPLSHIVQDPMASSPCEPNKHWHSAAGQAVLWAVNHACTFLWWHFTQDTSPPQKVQQACTSHLPTLAQPSSSSPHPGEQHSAPSCNF